MEEEQITEKQIKKAERKLLSSVSNSKKKSKHPIVYHSDSYSLMILFRSTSFGLLFLIHKKDHTISIGVIENEGDIPGYRKIGLQIVSRLAPTVVNGAIVYEEFLSGERHSAEEWAELSMSRL